MAETCAPRVVLAGCSPARGLSLHRALLDHSAGESQPAHCIQMQFSSLDSLAPVQPLTGFDQRSISSMRVREGIFRQAAFFFLWILIFVIPWENGVVIDGFGTLSRVVGIPAFGMALLTILESGTLRGLALQQAIMLSYMVWGSLTYFWSFAPSSTVTSIFTFIQLFTMVWLLWEFAQTRREQLLLLRAYALGSIVSSVATLTGFFSASGPQSGHYSGLNFDPGDLAFILALAIPISLYLAIQERRKILVWVDGSAAVLAFCSIVLTASRGSLIACTPTLLIFPFLFPKLRWGRNLLILVFLALAGIGSWLFMPESSWLRLSTIGSEITSGTLNERSMIWQVGWQVFGKAPLQGVGAGAYAPTVENTRGLASDAGGTESAGEDVGRLVAHNTFFSILVEQGVIGFALFFALLLTLALSAWKLSRVDRVFWLWILLTWAIGASNLTWDQRKPTWVIFGLLIAVAATKLAPYKRSLRQRSLPDDPAEFYRQASLPAEISTSQGLS
jgi:O-antigen ligase